MAALTVPDGNGARSKRVRLKQRSEAALIVVVRIVRIARFFDFLHTLSHLVLHHGIKHHSNLGCCVLLRLLNLRRTTQTSQTSQAAQGTDRVHFRSPVIADLTLQPVRQLNPVFRILRVSALVFQPEDLALLADGI